VNVCFILGNNHFPDEQNILFRTSQTSTTIDGFTNQTNNQVVFTSSLSLTVQGHGQSGITPTSGSNIANLTITVPHGEFTDFIINPHKTNTPSNILISARTSTGAFFNSGFFGGMGNNFMTILAAPGVEINQISMTALSGVSTVSQTRISGVEVIPEPSSMLLLGSGVLIFAQVLRRKLM